MDYDGVYSVIGVGGQGKGVGQPTLTTAGATRHQDKALGRKPSKSGERGGGTGRKNWRAPPKVPPYSGGTAQSKEGGEEGGDGGGEREEGKKESRAVAGSSDEVKVVLPRLPTMSVNHSSSKEEGEGEGEKEKKGGRDCKVSSLHTLPAIGRGRKLLKPKKTAPPCPPSAGRRVTLTDANAIYAVVLNKTEREKKKERGEEKQREEEEEEREGGEGGTEGAGQRGGKQEDHMPQGTTETPSSTQHTHRSDTEEKEAERRASPISKHKPKPAIRKKSIDVREVKPTPPLLDPYSTATAKPPPSLLVAPYSTTTAKPPPPPYFTTTAKPPPPPYFTTTAKPPPPPYSTATAKPPPPLLDPYSTTTAKPPPLLLVAPYSTTTAKPPPPPYFTTTAKPPLPPYSTATAKPPPPLLDPYSTATVRKDEEERGREKEGADTLVAGQPEGKREVHVPCGAPEPDTEQEAQAGKPLIMLSDSNAIYAVVLNKKERKTKEKDEVKQTEEEEGKREVQVPCGAPEPDTEQEPHEAGKPPIMLSDSNATYAVVLNKKERKTKKEKDEVKQTEEEGKREEHVPCGAPEPDAEQESHEAEKPPITLPYAEHGGEPERELECGGELDPDTPTTDRDAARPLTDDDLVAARLPEATEVRSSPTQTVVRRCKAPPTKPIPYHEWREQKQQEEMKDEPAAGPARPPQGEIKDKPATVPHLGEIKDRPARVSFRRPRGQIYDEQATVPSRPPKGGIKDEQATVPPRPPKGGIKDETATVPPLPPRSERPKAVGRRLTVKCAKRGSEGAGPDSAAPGWSGHAGPDLMMLALTTKRKVSEGREGEEGEEGEETPSPAARRWTTTNRPKEVGKGRP